MLDIERALIETDRFAWSRDQGALVIEADGDPTAADTYSVVAGVPDGDWELLLDEWSAAVLEAIPGAVIEDAQIGEADLWEEGPSTAVTISFSVGELHADVSP
jgi:hypothetical protein